MAEKITAYSLDVRPRVFDSVNRTRFFAGGTETKYLLSGRDVINARDTSFVQRVYDKELIDKWKKMKAAGLPVVPDLLLNPMRNIMLFTDVKADGSEVYGQGLKWCLRDSDIIPRDRPRPAIDTIFLELTTPQNFRTIERAAQGIVTIANTHSIELPDDDPMEFIIHPDGSWGFTILDLARAKIDTPRNLFDKRVREASNKFYTDNFLRNLKAIRGLLISGDSGIEVNGLFEE